MTARWWTLPDPDRLDETARGHDVIADAYEAKALWFSARAETFRREAERLRQEKKP